MLFICNVSVCFRLGKYAHRLRGGDKTIEIFPCPKCRSEFTLKSNQDVADLKSNNFINNMLEIMATGEKAKVSAKCSRCQDPAINHCATCDVFMCKKCSEWHDSWPTHKNDLVFTLEELRNPESQMKIKKKLMCKKHDDKIVEYHCETCHKLCCIDCVVLIHTKPNHYCVQLRQTAQKQRKKLQSSCTKLDEKLCEGKKALSKICEAMKSVEKNAKTTKDEIKNQEETILKAVAQKLHEKAKKMNEEVDEAYGEMRSELSKQHDEIKEYLDKVQASISLPRNLLKRGSVEEILSSLNLIDEKIEKLSSEKPVNLGLNAVNRGEIHYVPGEIDQINVDKMVDKLGYVEGMPYFFVSVFSGVEEL